MKQISYLASVLLLVIFLAGCNSKRDRSGNNEFAPTTTMEERGNYGGEQDDAGMNKTISDISQNKNLKDEEIPVEQTQRMIIRSGSMNLEVDNYNEAETKVTALVNGLAGYISGSTSNMTSAGKRQGTVTIKVPAEKFDELISKLGEIGEISSQNISSSDVTEEYIDLAARMKTQKELETRLVALLNDRTAKLSDVIEVEDKLSSVRQKIESTEGRMRYLRNQASYSTLALSIYEPSMLETSSGGGFFYEIGQGIKKGLEGFTEVLKGLIIFVIAFSPVLVFFLIVIFIIRKYLKRRKAKKLLETPPPANPQPQQG